MQWSTGISRRSTQSDCSTGRARTHTTRAEAQASQALCPNGSCCCRRLQQRRGRAAEPPHAASSMTDAREQLAREAVLASENSLLLVSCRAASGAQQARVGRTLSCCSSARSGGGRAVPSVTFPADACLLHSPSTLPACRIMQGEQLAMMAFQRNGSSGGVGEAAGQATWLLCRRCLMSGGGCWRRSMLLGVSIGMLRPGAHIGRGGLDGRPCSVHGAGGLGAAGGLVACTRLRPTWHAPAFHLCAGPTSFAGLLSGMGRRPTQLNEYGSLLPGVTMVLRVVMVLVGLVL